MEKNKKEIITLSKIIIQNYNVKNSRNLKRVIKTKPINILVETIEHINDFEILKFFLFCSIKIRLGEIFISLSYDNKLFIIKNANNQLLRDIFEDIEIDDVYELINSLPKNEFKKILLLISPDTRKKLAFLSNYEEGEVGSIMNSSFVKIYSDYTIAKAVKEIENNKEDLELNSIVFIIDKEEKLVGKVHIYNILLEKQRSLKIKKIMDKKFVSINNHEDIENLVSIFQKYDLKIMPVVSSNNKLLGLVDESDIISAIQEEVTEDIYKMYGINELDKPYIRTRVFDIVKSRILWLILLMIASTFTSMVLDGFEHWSAASISTAILIPIIPVISGTSGNAGSQSSATIIRSLSIGEISTKEYNKIIFKEFLVAVCIGLILSFVNFLRLIIYYQISPIQGTFHTHLTKIEISSIISSAISLALFIAILLSKIVGSILPILATKMKIDPAAMASPMLTTIIDTLTITILFLIGTSIINLIS